MSFFRKFFFRPVTRCCLVTIKKSFNERKYSIFGRKTQIKLFAIVNRCAIENKFNVNSNVTYVIHKILHNSLFNLENSEHSLKY